MGRHIKTISLGIGVLAGFIIVMTLPLSGCFSDEPAASHSQPSGGDVPVKGMPTMVDLGANECIPCKMMVPVMEKVEKKYKGKAAIVFIDVWKNKEAAKRFNVRAIPTQIFFDENGEEVYRHTGFMSETDIVSRLREMGVG